MAKIKTTVNLISYDGFNKEETEKLFRAVELLTVGINSDAFKRSVLAHAYKGKKQFAKNDGLTNQQVYNRFMSGDDRNGNGADNKLDLRWKIVATLCPETAIGTTFNRTRTETYRCKLQEMDAGEFAGHIAHEYCHYLGFGHTRHHTAERPYTVPYGIGKMVRRICDVVMSGVTAEDLKKLAALQQLVK